MASYFSEHAPYPKVLPFTWPKPGVRTWEPPDQSFFGPCTGRPDCTADRACPVGLVVTVNGGPYGCDCTCHDARRTKL